MVTGMAGAVVSLPQQLIMTPMSMVHCLST